MDCETVRDLLGPHLDGELDLLRSVEVEDHLAACPACARERQSWGSLRSALRTADLAEPAPPRLRRAVEQSLRKSVGARRGRSRLLAASVAFLGLALGAGAFYGRAVSWGEDGVAREVFASHVRSLQAEGHRVDVASSDRHTVKPWFNDRLDYAPEVKDLSGQGFPLLGGRLDYIGNRTTAALIYGRRAHVINLWVWPTDQPDRPPEWSERQGYHLGRWRSGKMEYWVASDLNTQELTEFVNAVR